MGINRNLDPDLLDSLGTFFNPIVLVYVDWPTGTVRCHTGIGDISFQGHTWTGLGAYGNIKVPEEGNSIVNVLATMSLAAPLDTLMDELDQNPRNCDVEIYWGTTTEPSGNVLIGTPALLYTGYVDSVDFGLSRQSRQTATSGINIGVASGPSARSKATINHSPEDQKKKFPGDTAGRQLIHAMKKAANPDVWPEP